MKTVFSLTFILFSIPIYINAQSDSRIALKAIRLSDNIIIVQTESGTDNQLALNTDEGIVVFGTHWGLDIEREYRAIVEKVFKQTNYKYVINPQSRIISTGGNALYKDAIIIAEEDVYNEMLSNNVKLQDELQKEIRVFTLKAERSRNILMQENLSKEDQEEHTSWMNYCQRIADDLRAGYDLVLPTVVFTKKIYLNLGNMVLQLDRFNKNGLIIWIPEEKFLMFTSMFDPLHIIVLPRNEKLEIDKWIVTLENYIAKCSDVKQVVLGYKGIWPLKKIEDRKNFIKHLWSAVQNATMEGKDFDTVKNELSLDNEFSYIKGWDVYKNEGEDWVKGDFEKILVELWIQLHTPIDSYIENYIDKHGVEKGVYELYDILKNRKAEFYISENNLNTLGYRLLNKELLDTAIEVFKINAEYYPESANAYDSLGEAYMKNGQLKLAISSYEKSLELNPENANAKEMIIKLNNY